MTATVTRPVAAQNKRVCGNGSGAGYRYSRFNKIEKRLRQAALIIPNTSLNTDRRGHVGFTLHNTNLFSTTHIGDTNAYKLGNSGNKAGEESKNTDYGMRHKR